MLWTIVQKLHWLTKVINRIDKLTVTNCEVKLKPNIIKNIVEQALRKVENKIELKNVHRNISRWNYNFCNKQLKFINKFIYFFS